MYSVYARKGTERICIYNDSFQLDDTIAIDPKLELSDSLAGTFKIKLPGKNNGYEFVERLNTEIIIYKNKKEIWSGRVIKEDTDFWKNRTIECEGELAYLNDTTQPQAEFHDISPRALLEEFIRVHNSKAPDDKKFTVGAVTVTDPNDSLYRYTNYESTLEAINDKLLKRLGGFLRIRKVDDVRYLDYIREQDRDTSTQIIQFGRNLLDFTKSYDATDFCTVVLPLGARLTEEDGSSASEIEALEAYVTVEEVNEGSPYVVNADTIDEFGWIEKKVTWNDVEEPANLLRKAQEYLSEVQFDNMELEVNAVDLGYLESDFDNINISEQVKVISRVHGLNRFFPVKKISIPLNDPAHTTFTMGTAVKTNFTARTNSGVGYVEDLIDEIPSESEILNFAKRNATALIKANTTGYITITTRDNGTNELFITDVPLTTYDPEDPSKEASRYWQWNLDGLGYFNKNDARFNNPEGLKLALTMDGAIVADFITVGTLNAERIKAGILQGYNNQDNWWNLLTGELHIGLSAKYGNDDQTIATRFAVTDGLITTEVKRATDAEDLLGSKITQTAEAISTSVYVSGKWYDPGSYTISVSGVGNPNGVIDTSSYTYKYYMDISNGYIYRSNGSSWNYVTTATAKTNSLASNIIQTAEAISTEVQRATDAESSISSKLLQTATAISTSVYVSGKWYDPGSYTISVSGVGNPNGVIDTSSYTYKYYMDISNGYIYRSNGSSWNYVTTATAKTNSLASNIIQTAEAISTEVQRATDAESSISSKLLQTATAISSSVSASGKWYDPGSYTISVSGVGSPVDQYSPSSYFYQYYMDISNGNIYYSNGYSWSYITRATQQTGSMASKITQTASEVSLKISKGEEFVTELSANANAIRLKSDKIVVSSTNFNVDADGNMSCTNADIKGDITVGGNNNTYGSIYVRDGSGNVKFYINADGINNGYNFYLSSDGLTLGSFYAGSTGTVSLEELDIRDSRGVFVYNGNDARQGWTGTKAFYAYKGTGASGEKKYMHFKNGILYSIDDSSDDGFTPGP